MATDAEAADPGGPKTGPWEPDDRSAVWAYRRIRGLLIRLTPADLHTLATADIPEVKARRLMGHPGWYVPPPARPAPPEPDPVPAAEYDVLLEVVPKVAGKRMLSHH